MDQRQFFLRDILTVVFKHLTLIILLPLIVLLLVFFGNYIWPATYESEAKLRLLRGREAAGDADLTQATNTVMMAQTTVEDINSEVQVLLSRDVLHRVVADLDLANSDFPYYSGIFNAPFEIAQGISNAVLYLLQIKEKPPADLAAVQELAQRLEVEMVRDSFVMNVSLELGDPQKAKEILEAILKTYLNERAKLFKSNVDDVIENRLYGTPIEGATPGAQTEGLAESEKSIQEQLRDSEAALTSFLEEHNISLLDQEKELLLEQYTDAQRTLTELAQTRNAITAQDPDAALIASLSSQTENIVVREMQLRLLELLTELNRAAESLGPTHPTIMSLKNQIRNLQQNLIEAIANTNETTQQRLTEINERLQTLNQLKAEADQLQQRMDFLQGQYEFYLQKLEDVTVGQILNQDAFSNVKIISWPTAPVNPIRPNKLLNLLLALIGGIIIALAIAFFLDYLDHGLKTPEDVEYYVKVPPLASFFNTPGQPLDSRQAERLAVLINAAHPTGVTQMLMVTSSVPNEGSDAVANALANAYANDPNTRTLMIDLTGDVSRARTARYGLTDVMLDQADFDEVFSQQDALTIVGRGSHADYPTSLWRSDRMRQLIADLRTRYQHIVFHVGAVLQSQDALTLSRHIDGILIVIKSDSTRREVVNRALDSIRDVRPKVIGAVMTERTQTIPQAVYRRI